MPLDRGVGCLAGVFPAQVRPDDKHHITGKPTELMLRIVEICAHGGLILDFCGSATTGVAALRRGCRFIGSEREPSCAAIARDRLRAEEQLSALSALRVGQTPLFGCPSHASPRAANAQNTRNEGP